MNYGSCCGCGQTIKYEKVNVCKNCEDKYIKQVMDYAYQHGLNLSVEELNKELGIPLKVLKLFEMNGFLKSISEGKDIEVNNSQDEKNSKLALLRSLEKSFSDEKKQTIEEKKAKLLEEMERSKKPRMHTNYRK